jgi:hypothetical protein
MHHLLDVIDALLNLLSIPFPRWRRKGEKRTQLEEAQRIILLITFGAILIISVIIWFANYLGHRQ